MDIFFTKKQKLVVILRFCLFYWCAKRKSRKLLKLGENCKIPSSSQFSTGFGRRSEPTKPAWPIDRFMWPIKMRLQPLYLSFGVRLRGQTLLPPLPPMSLRYAQMQTPVSNSSTVWPDPRSDKADARLLRHGVAGAEDLLLMAAPPPAMEPPHLTRSVSASCAWRPQKSMPTICWPTRTGSGRCPLARMHIARRQLPPCVVDLTPPRPARSRALRSRSPKRWRSRGL
jgi:hypothetical protein